MTGFGIFSFPFRGKAGMGASGAGVRDVASPHPNPGAGGETPPLFDLSRFAQAKREPQLSAPKGEGEIQGNA